MDVLARHHHRPATGLFVYLGTPGEKVNFELLEDADWGGMLLLGFGMAMIYSGLDQANRLNWFESGIMWQCFQREAFLTLIFFVNETIVRRPWAHANVLFSRNVGWPWR